MKNSKIIYIAALFLSILLTLTFSALRLVALLTEFDTQMMYYSHEATLPAFFGWGAIVSLFIFGGFCFLIRGELKGIDIESDSPVVTFTSSLLAFMIIASFIYNLLSMGESIHFVRVLAAVFALPAALYHLLGIALPVKGKNSRLLLGAFMLLWLFAVLMSVYFTTGQAINNPNKTLNLAAIAMFLLFFVNECRFRAKIEKPGRYIFFGFAVIVICGMYSLPNIVTALMRVYPDKIDITLELTEVCMWLYVLVRMCSYSELVGETEAEASEAEEAAVEAEEAIEASEGEASAAIGASGARGAVSHVQSALRAAVNEYDDAALADENVKKVKRSAVKGIEQNIEQSIEPGAENDVKGASE